MKQGEIEREPSKFVTEGVAIVARMDLPVDLDRLDEDRQSQLKAWIKHRLRRQRVWNKKESSYWLKMKYEEETGNYVTNGQMKGMMKACGYGAENERMLEWRYKVCVRSDRMNKLTSVNQP